MDNYLNKLGLDLLLEDISKSIINHTSSSIEDNTTEPNNFPTVRAVINYCKSNIFLQAAVFGGIINEEITPILESIDKNDYMQVIFCKPLNSFYYRIEESGTTKYYANWNTKENYVDKYGYPYVGKLYFNVSNKKYYYYSLTGLKKLVMDTIIYFENLIDDSDTDIEISYQSTSDENTGEVIWSKKFNRFVFSTNEGGDTVYYDNWPTRDYYMDRQSVKLMHFYLNGTDEKLYFTDPDGVLTKVTDNFLKAESNQVSKFIPITAINNAFDVNTVFNGNPLLVKDFHWKYYVTADRSVVGILEVTVGQNNSGIEITERFTTSWVFSNKTFRPAGEGHNIYTRHCYSYRDDSREIMPSVWTTWYEVPKLTIAEKEKLADLHNYDDTAVRQLIADVDADRRAAPFGKIIKEQIDIEEESYGGDILEDQICYSTVLSTFVYKEFGTTKYYANWPTKKHYIGADGYPYLGKQFYCHDEDKMYYFDGMKLKAVQIPAVVSFFDVVDDDIDIIMGSVAEEDDFPEYEIVFSMVHDRFVYKADDGKFYDNWSTRYLYVNSGGLGAETETTPRTDVLYFALDASKLYMYDYEMSSELMPINADLSGFLNKNDHALTEFITAGQEATVVDYENIFNGAAGEISKMHWMYFIHIQQKVVGIMDVQVSYAGSASRIRITERLRTRALLSNDKKSIEWQPSLEWNEDHEYTRFILSYNDMSQDIKAGEWTAWYKYSERFTTTEKTKLTELPTNNELKSTLDRKVEVYDIDFSSDPYNFTNSNWKNADTLPAFITKLQEYLNTNYRVFTSQIIEAIEQNRILRLVNHNTDGNINYALPVDLNHPDGNKSSITFVYECVFNSPTKHTRICKLCIPLNDSKGKVTYEILPSDYAINEQREIALCHKINKSETLDVTPYWGKYLVVTYPANDSSMSTIQIAFSSKLSDGEMWVRLKGSPTVSVDGAVVTKGIDFVQGKEKILHVTKSGETFEFETLDGVNDEISYNSSGYRVDLYGGSREYITVTERALELRLVARNIDLEFPNKTMTAMAYLNIITDTPNITIGNPLITTKYQENFKLEKGYYEFNCLFNGKEWVVAAMKIGEE